MFVLETKRKIVEELVAKLNSANDKGVLLIALIKLRTDIVKDDKGIELFRQCGGIKPLVRFLNKPHEKILEVVLSLLANCCTNDICCKEALQCKVYIPLAAILKSIPNPVIKLRGCRLLGNLGKYDNQLLLATHCPAIAQTICQTLLDTSDMNIRIMALRACRFLLENENFLQHFLISNGLVIIIRLLTSVMRKETSEPQTAEGCFKRTPHREKQFEEGVRNFACVGNEHFDNKLLKNSLRPCYSYVIPEESPALELSTDIMKCLLVMSNRKIDQSVWMSLNRNNCTFDPIVAFVTGENKGRSVALKILSNFSKNSGAHLFLSSADAIAATCDLLVSSNLNRPLDDVEVRHCVNIACILCTDACNRAKIRRSGAIRKLIAIAKESESKSQISAILYIFNHFEYDHTSLELMINDGLISVLIKQLNLYLSSDDEYHKKKRQEKLQQVAKKRKIINEASDMPNQKIARTRTNSVPFDFESPSNSPKYCMSPSSPSSSRSMSPIGREYTADFVDPISDDERYSPACSDDDDSNGQGSRTTTASTSEGSDIMKLLDIACRPEAIEDNLLDKEDDDDISQGGQDAKVNLPNNAIDFIENLLFRATLLTRKSRELGQPETMNTLIKAISTFGCGHYFAVTLTNILLESQFFALVIKHGIVHQIYQLTKINTMQKEAYGLLETLTCVGESNYGKEELARMLNSDVAVDQIRASITVAYIVKNRNLLYQFLYNGNALNQLLNVIIQNNCDYANDAVDALTSMMTKTLHKHVPQLMEMDTAMKHEEFSENDSLVSDEQRDMRFIVHEKSTSDLVGEIDTATKINQQSSVTIDFNKKLLCDTSEVFSKMLNSNFREGNEGEIHLTTFTAVGLKYFLNLVVRHALKKPINNPQSNQYGALLEAFELSRMYIIPSMELTLQHMLIGLLDEDNCLGLYEWSVRNYHTELTEMAINYYLCSSLPTDNKIALFRKANDSTYSKEWHEMIVNTVYVHCTNGF